MSVGTLLGVSFSRLSITSLFGIEGPVLSSLCASPFVPIPNVDTEVPGTCCSGGEESGDTEHLRLVLFDVVTDLNTGLEEPILETETTKNKRNDWLSG